MPTNVYQQQGGAYQEHGGSAVGSLLGIGALFGAEYLYDKWSYLGQENVTRATLGKSRHFGAAMGPTRDAATNMAKYNKSYWWWGKRRAHKRMSRRLSHEATRAFFGSTSQGMSRGWGWEGLKSRYKAAATALEKIPGIGKGKAPVARALLRGPLGFATSYMMWGSMIPASVELGLGMFNELAAEGARLRGTAPETIGKNYDMATRQQAFTMRQASLMAMHQSQTGVRAAIGSEASFLH